MKKQKNSIAIAVLVLIILVQSGIIAYLLIKNTSKKEVIVSQQDKISKDSVELASKAKELKSVGEGLQKIKADIISMGMDSNSISKEINDLIELLWQVEMGGAVTIDQLTTKLKQYKALSALKDKQIKQLKSQSDSLTIKASNLTEEKETKSQDIVSIKSETNTLSKQVAIASILKAGDFKIAGINKKNKVLEKELYKAKELVKLKISFCLEDNKVAKKNSKTMLLRLIDADGVVVFNESKGGGFFKTKENEAISYTEMQRIDFDNSGQVVNFIYEKENEFNSGKYKVEIYAEGCKIGESKFAVK